MVLLFFMINSYVTFLSIHMKKTYWLHAKKLVCDNKPQLMDNQERPQNVHDLYQYIQTIRIIMLSWWWILITMLVVPSSRILHRYHMKQLIQCVSLNVQTKMLIYWCYDFSLRKTIKKFLVKKRPLNNS